jgi:cyclophilin family peptidyl-prolyl cis-trans isomerase
MASSSPPRSLGSSFSSIRRNNSGAVLPLHIDSASSILLQSPLSPDSSCSSKDSISLRCSSPPEPSKLPPNRNHSTGSLLTRRSHRGRPLPTTWDDVQRGGSFSQISRSNSKNSSKDNTWSSNSTRDSSRSSNNKTIAVFILGGLFFCGIWAGCYIVVNTYLASHDEALKLSLRETEILPMTRAMEAKVSTLERENMMLHERYEQATIMQQQQQEDPRLLEQIHSLSEKAINYKQSIQKLSRYAMLERFGPGPHHVEIELAFDPASSSGKNVEMDEGSNNKIILELAKAEEMPHSVFLFLEQVTRGLFDGASFHRNAVHVVQGGPHTNFMSPPDANLYNRFKRSGFEHVMFQEYHPNWSHQTYTIGYAGRPAGGPDFYFNMLDNARIHGPGGQASTVEAEPCFGKVIAGFDLVDRMHASPVQPGPYHALEHNVAIVKMRLMEPSEPSLFQLQHQLHQQQAELPNTATS